MLAYTVAAQFTDPNVALEWLDWLKGGHVEEVLAGGAISAQIVLIENDQDAMKKFEVRYLFPDGDAFKSYESLLAPRLREDGLKKFPPERGVTYRRTVGHVLATWPAR